MLNPEGQDGVGQHFPGAGGLIWQALGRFHVTHLKIKK